MDLLPRYRVYYKLDGEVLYHHMMMNFEEKRVWFPSVSTEGEILGVSASTGLYDKEETELFKDDVLLIDDKRIVKIVWNKHNATFDSMFIGDTDEEFYNIANKFKPIDNRNWCRRAVKIGNLYQGFPIPESCL